ncbi:winged helix-turn-helix domain-containing protein [Streptomyces sp. NPDC048172]|uniref:winged helix-turn-helix domain-containing protein n=1 Tax=Streptomyces sp. NPDC048172 TaxID=3365505 RepID=UPI00371009AD
MEKSSAWQESWRWTGRTGEGSGPARKAGGHEGANGHENGDEDEGAGPVIRIRCTAADLARVCFAPRPAPLLELNTALAMMLRRDDDLLLGRWRRRLLRALPAAAEPLADLVPGGTPPLFLDVFADSVTEGQQAVRSTPPDLVRAELARVYARHPAPPPRWIHALHRGEAEAWQRLLRAQRAAFEAAVRPVWDQVQDLHRAEFTRHALTVAERGIGAALTDAVPGSRFRDGVWECPGPHEADLALDGRTLVLRPTFHWTAHPLLAAPPPPGDEVTVTYPAGPGLPLPRAADGDGGLSDVLGRTRAEALRLLEDEHTTSQLARRLRVSNATASAHAAALRGAGLITTTRAGRAVLHRRAPLGDLLARRRDGDPSRA